MHPILQCIYFYGYTVAAKVAETKVHKILGKELTVELKKPTTVQKATTVTGHEQVAILINNVADTISDDLLYLYIDKITELEGESGDYVITRCDRLQVIITFNASANLPTGGTYIYSQPWLAFLKFYYVLASYVCDAILKYVCIR